MYRYDGFDQQIVRDRARQFRDQVDRRLAGELLEDHFKPLRLQNGLYMQLHSYMWRIAIPYGLLSSEQLRVLARITRDYDRGYAHFTTRQNLQLNWIDLSDVPVMLDELAEVDMHAIQTSGNCIRNVTSDPFAGVAADEIEDPRPYCEILRQWSTFHPEFAYLPRKFKFAVTGATQDRAAVALHDVGLRLVRHAEGDVGFEVQVGGGQGRTPFLAKVIRSFLPKRDLLSYVEAILRVYNRQGRRDNKFKARIKILVDSLGVDGFAALVEEEFGRIRDGSLALDEVEIERMKSFFAPPVYDDGAPDDNGLQGAMLAGDRTFSQWFEGNVAPHRADGYAIVQVSLKTPDRPPGDVTDAQLDALADIADQYSLGELVVTHRQNLVLPHVRRSDLPKLHARLVGLDLGAHNVGKVTDTIACPGLDYCNLANARSLNIAQAVAERFADFDHLHDLGDVTLNISGCINACGHHHVGNIGVLGIDKQGVEHYQLMLGGSADNDASLGKVLGRALEEHEVADAIERVLARYVELRRSKAEVFIDTFRRVGPSPFKEAVYGAA